MNEWRLVSEEYDGHATCQLLCCKKYVFCGPINIITWTFCPFCGNKLGSQLACRKSETPKWLYNIRDKSEDSREYGEYNYRVDYDLIPRQSEKLYFEVESRYILHYDDQEDYVSQWTPEWPGAENPIKGIRDEMYMLWPRKLKMGEVTTSTYQWRVVYRTKSEIKRSYQPHWACIGRAATVKVKLDSL